jgi:hypothetical protein
MRSADARIYFPVALAGVVLVCATTFVYAWSSTFVDLACSIQDDSFYYLIPAWNGGHGTGLTFGGEKTSGFQPLYEIILTAVSHFCESLESLVRFAISFNGYCFAFTALLVGLAVRPLMGATAPGGRPAAGALSMCVGAISFLSLHTAYFSSVTGKENALGALLLVTIIWSVLSGCRNLARSLLLGLLCGLLLVTRIAPASILYTGIAIFFLESRKARIVAIVAGLIPLTAWALFAQVYFGHVLPMSMLVKMAAPNHLSLAHSIKSGLQYFWESGKFSLSAQSRFNLLQLQARDGVRSAFQVAVMVAALIVAVVAAVRSLLAGTASRAILALLAFDVGGVFSNVIFGTMQAGRSDDMYYSVWYVYDLPVLVAINCGFAMAWAQSMLASSRFRARTTAILAVACAAYFIGDLVWYARLKPYGAADDAKFAASWQNKEFEVASWFRNNVTPNRPQYKVVAYSAGALSYYLYDHVVNLDGLANNAAGEAVISTQSAVGYVQALKPDYLIEICGIEKQFSNLERLHVVSFRKQGNFCIDRFVYPQ